MYLLCTIVRGADVSLCRACRLKVFFLYLLNELWVGTALVYATRRIQFFQYRHFRAVENYSGRLVTVLVVWSPETTPIFFWSGSYVSKIIIVCAISWSSFVTMSSPPAKRKKHVDSKYQAEWSRFKMASSKKEPVCLLYRLVGYSFLSHYLRFLVLCGYFFLPFLLHPLLPAVATFSDVLQLLSIRLRISSLISAILQLISYRLSIPAFYCQYQPVSSLFLRYLRVCPYKWLHIVVCVSLCSHRTYHDLEWLNVKLWRHKYWNCIKNDDQENTADPGILSQWSRKINGRAWQVCLPRQ